MTSYARRAGANILRTIAQVLDPAAETGRALMYGKSTPVLNGQPQLFVRSPDFPRQISGVEANAWDRPLSPSIYDDEFESTVLSGSWTQIGAGGWAQGNIDPYAGFVNGAARYELHTQRRPSWIMAQPPNDGTGYELRKVIAPAGDFFTYFRGSFNVRITATQNSESAVFLQLSTNPWDNNNRVYIKIGPDGANLNSVRFYRVQAGVGTLIGGTAQEFSTTTGMQPIDMGGITRRGNNFDGWAFTANGNAIWLGTTALAIAPGMASLQFVTTMNTVPGNKIGGVDFFRYRDGRTYLP